MLTPPTSYDIHADAMIIRISRTPQGPRYVLTLDRVAELMDSAGRPIGMPVRLPSHTTPVSEIADRQYTVDGITLSVAEIMAFVQLAIDDLKGEGLEQQSPAY